MTLAQLGNKEECWVDEENGTFLMHRGCAEVSVFYFRTAYSPEQLKTQQVNKLIKITCGESNVNDSIMGTSKSC